MVVSRETLLEQLQRRQRVLDRRIAQLEFEVMVIGNKRLDVRGEIRQLGAEYALLSVDAMLGYYGAPQEVKVKQVIDWEQIYGDEA